MEEERLLKKQFFLHIVYNMFAFSLIFVIFGIFVFFMVKNITFSSVDKQLREGEKQFINSNERMEKMYKLFELEKIDENLQMETREEFSFPDNNFSRRIENPQITLLLRDSDGNILNETELGRISDYLDDIVFENDKIDIEYNCKIGNKYNYRGINFEVSLEDNEEVQYVQLLINVDSEISLVNSYMKIIIYSVVLCILLSGIASYILSRKTLKPVEDVLRKQTEFVQNASHELRTPLTIIQAKQELLLQEPDSKIIDKSEDIMLTLSETKRLSKLTKDLMLLVKGSNLQLQKEEIDIDEFLRSVVVPYMDIAEMQNKKIFLNLNFKKIQAIDTNKIHQLMVILLDNAIKYTENGDEIRINTYLKDNKCVIEVCDTGIGISDEGINRIFERFYREDKARNRETGGSGLGLSIASMIVKAHNGTIRAEHNGEKGTKFIIRLMR